MSKPRACVASLATRSRLLSSPVLALQVSKNERQIMKPLYDRYRLVKQILSRASTVPIIVSPSTAVPLTIWLNAPRLD